MLNAKFTEPTYHNFSQNDTLCDSLFSPQDRSPHHRRKDKPRKILPRKTNLHKSSPIVAHYAGHLGKRHPRALKSYGESDLPIFCFVSLVRSLGGLNPLIFN